MSLEGCWTSCEVEPLPESRIAPSLGTIDPLGWHYGIATLPNGRRVACGSSVTIDLEGVDWLDFSIPMEVLVNTYGVGSFPFGSDDSGGWRNELDRWLVALGKSVYCHIPFELALVGHEVGSEISAVELSKIGLPAERWIGYLWGGQAKSDDLEWHPPTKYG